MVVTLVAGMMVLIGFACGFIWGAFYVLSEQDRSA